ncbi:MAG TPA: PDZ domain-containing protein [Pseudogracilibacillus sp.]|nr:PDZ domain-containing protein [Pseudogracilibacillus sp.]
MVEHWGLQLLYAFGRMFLNPLLYWALILLMIAGARRLKRERTNFGVKIFDYFNEINGSFWFALLFGLLLSILTIVFGFVLGPEVIIVLAIVTILLSITGSFQFLSPAYTLGCTFFICLLLPILPLQSMTTLLQVGEPLSTKQFTIITILIGLFMIAESLLIYRAKMNHVYPAVTLGERGIWLGEQQLKRLAVIPFLMFIPANELTNVGPILPYFQLGEDAYYIVIVPFIMGAQILTRYGLAMDAKQLLAKQKLYLSLVVLGLGIASYFYSLLSFLAIVLALIGTEWIMYCNRLRNQYEAAYFGPVNEGVKVLGTIPKSRAAELEILPGEIITKVNGIKVADSQQFYKALQQSGAFFKLDVLDKNNEVRFIQSAFYAEDHHGLGILFSEAPFGERHKERYEQLSQL